MDSGQLGKSGSVNVDDFSFYEGLRWFLHPTGEFGAVTEHAGFTSRTEMGSCPASSNRKRLVVTTFGDGRQPADDSGPTLATIIATINTSGGGRSED
jgi:hypothetical protein